MVRRHSSLAIPVHFSAGKKQHIAADRIALLFKQSPMGILGTMGCAVILAYLFRGFIDHPILIVWLGLALASSLFRTLLLVIYYKRDIAPGRIAYWGRLNIISLGFSGIIWGAASLMIFPTASLPHQFFLMLVICGMVAGAAMAFAVIMRAFLIFTVPAIGGLAIRMAMLQTDMHLFMGILAVVFWMLSFLIAVNIRKTRLQLLVLKEDLADRVYRRTADLAATNARLRAEIQQRIDAQDERQKISAKLEASRKVEAIATLAGGMAHQFNNDLSVIMGAVGLMKMDAGPVAMLPEYIEAIERTAEHMSRLTNQLLAYAQGGRYKPKTVDVAEFIQTTLALTEHTFLPSITVEIEMAPDLPAVTVDITQMQMAASAIIANAVEAMAATSGRLTISGTVEAIPAEQASNYGSIAPGRYVKISFADTGIGMGPETLNRVFDPFFSTKFQGRGLAMAAVYGIIHNHGGHISVTSQESAGTTVQILLPAVEAGTVQRSDHAAPDNIHKGNGSILLIEDEELVMRVNKTMLTHLGYHVICAATGKSAMAVIGDSTVIIDLILLDIKLSDMDGSAIFPLIQNLRPRVHVLVCSGYAMDDAAQQLIKAGAFGFLQKPFTMDMLAHWVGRALDAAQAS